MYDIRKLSKINLWLCFVPLTFRIFARMNTDNWSENVILADADYVDKVAFDLTVNFERMIGRRIPQADMARWIDCVALDGGLREKEQADGNETQVVLIHDKAATCMKHFTPSEYDSQLNGVAFKDHLGEFVLSSYPVESMTTKEDFFMDVLQTISQQKAVRRLMVIADDNIYSKVREALNRIGDNERHTTVFTMQPMPGGQFRQEILGYSLMAALGIRSDEIKSES